MKSLSIIAILFIATLSYAQKGGSHGGGSAPSGPPASAGGGMGASNAGTGSGTGHAGSTSTNSNGRTGSADSHSQKPSTTDLLNQNTKLSSNLQKLLPAGTTPQQACSGFKNLGQCVAAIHVSNNLGISFSDLKNKTTGANAENLGKAIHDLKPDVNAKGAKKKAEAQAKNDLSS